MLAKLLRCRAPKKRCPSIIGVTFIARIPRRLPASSSSAAAAAFKGRVHFATLSEAVKLEKYGGRPFCSCSAGPPLLFWSCLLRLFSLWLLFLPLCLFFGQDKKRGERKGERRAIICIQCGDGLPHRVFPSTDD